MHPAGMVRTPWGYANELRSRKLPPGPGTGPEEVTRNQRDRLYAATVAVISEKGYMASTVEDLVEVSGVSRKDFYRHFDNKQACFLATVEALIEPTIATISKTKAPSGEEQLREAFETFMGLLVSQAAATRVCFVELHAAGPEADRVAQRAFEAFEGLVQEASGQLLGREGMPPQIVRAVIGGLRKVIHTRLYRGEEETLLELAPELWRWGLSYYPPPLELRARRRAARRAVRVTEGYTAEERIARAAAAVIAEKGYLAMRPADIAKRASISLKTFYAHFADKEDALLVALELSGSLMLARVTPVVQRAEDWRVGVRVVYEAMCSFLVAEPVFAQLVVADVYAAGQRALEQRDSVIDTLQAMLAPGFEQAPETPRVAAEAIGGAVYSLLGDQLRAGGPESMLQIVPLATYLTLTPFLGPYEAAVIANGDGRRSP